MKTAAPARREPKNSCSCDAHASAASDNIVEVFCFFFPKKKAFLKSAKGQTSAEIERSQCLDVRLQPDGIASMALFLSAEDSRYATSQDFHDRRGLVMTDLKRKISAREDLP